MSNSNKLVCLLCAICAVVVVSAVIVYIGFSGSSDESIPEVAESEQVSGYRYELSTKEEQMLRQYSLEMHNSYDLNVTKYYVEDLDEGSLILHVEFDNENYYGELEYNNSGKWTARLHEVKYV